MNVKFLLVVLLIVLLFLPLVHPAFATSTVGTSTSSIATSYPFQRKSFYANGRFWVFYSDGTNMVYCTSTDGSTWSSVATVRAATAGYKFSVWFDGTYLHYAYASASSIYYRRGTPNSDGTISWSTDSEQPVSTTYNKAYYPMVSVDSNVTVWIGYMDYSGTYYYPYVIKSGNNDGTWGTTPSGFPYKLSTTSSNVWKVSVIPLTAGKMLAVYACDGSTVRAKKWDGSVWGTEVATTSNIYVGRFHSAVAQGDDVHLTFLKSTTYDILYVKYTYSSNSFGTETTLQAGATSTSVPVISIDTATNDLYVFAATKTTGTPSGWTAEHIYYVKYTASSGTWGSWTDWIDETTEVLTSADYLTCFYKAYGNYIGLVYMTKTASPYNVKFAFLTLAGGATYNFYGSASLTYTVNTLKTIGFNRYGTSTLTFTIQTLANFVSAQTLNLFGSATLNFLTNAIKAMAFNCYGISSLTFTIDTVQNSLRTLSFHGSANLNFLTIMYKTFGLTRYGITPLTFTIKSLVEGLEKYLTFYGSAVFNFTVYGQTIGLEVIDLVSLALCIIALAITAYPLTESEEKALPAVVMIFCIVGLAFALLGLEYSLAVTGLAFILAVASMAKIATKKD